MAKHLSVGNLNLDMYIVVESLPGPDENAIARDAYIGPGGAAANYAVAAARLGDQPYLVAHTGRLLEELGITARLRREGVSLDYVKIHDDQMPGLVIVLVTAGGERTMITMRGANNLLRGDEAQGSFNVAHVASRGPDVLQRVCSSVAADFTSYDPGASNTSRYPDKVVEAARKCSDILVLNRAEYRHIAGTNNIDVARDLLGGRLRMILVKRGAEGAVLVTAEEAYIVEAYRAGQVVDTTGAGDVFIAAFNVYLLRTGDPAKALQAASIAAGIKVTRRGAQSAPSREEVERALRTNPPRVARRRRGGG